MLVPVGSFFFAGEKWLWPAVIGFALAVVLCAITYLRTAGPRALRVGCASLKILGVGALLLCLLEPAWSEKRAKPGANILTVVADNSLSMKLRGGGESEPRGEVMRRIVTGEQSGWRSRLAEHFEVRNFLADARLQTTESFAELNFEGRTSALGASLRGLSERYRSQPLAGVILLTDGIASDALDSEMPGLPPIYPVIFGRDQPSHDLAISNAAVTQTAFEDAPVTVQADVSALGYRGEEIVGKLIEVDPTTPDSEPRVIAEQTVVAPRDDGKMVFRFQFRPEKVGVLFYKVKIAAKGKAADSPQPPDEATSANNETTVMVDRSGGPHRILYVSGRPNWEYKFLRRAIEADDQTQLVALVRIAKREPKFEFRGRAGESSNPLFRGFGEQSKEEVERYDQPVLIRLNTQDEFELRDGFPKAAEDLFKYRAVIVDDLEAEFFTTDQMGLLQRFVSERGGGFLMLGGAESFVEGKFGRTPIGDMLPVYVDRVPPAPAAAELRLKLTREGWLQPWARLRTNEADEKKRLAELPYVQVLNRAREAKPAAMVLATVSDGATEYPALVTQRFGRGRSAALLVGDLWHVGLGDETLQKDLGRAWRQMVRWLVADVPQPVEIRAEPQPGDAIKIQVRVRDPKFQPVENAAVMLQVLPVAAKDAAKLTAEASPEEPGLYETTYIPRESGGYRIDAEVTNENGARVGSGQGGWAADLAAAEFRSLAPNRALMEQLARRTGGEVLNPDQLAKFVDQLPEKRSPITETITSPLWHTPFMFLFALACFVGEWGLRRWKGLA